MLPCLVENPPWVTGIIAKHYVELEEGVPPKWLPKLTRPRAGVPRRAPGAMSAALDEYGCGAYGCVLPTLDPRVVLKLTSDDTEAEFARDLSSRLAAPVAVRYHLTKALPDKHKKRSTYLLWRDAADRVGEIAKVVEERGGDAEDAEQAIGAQHEAAQAVFDALHEGMPAHDLLEEWEAAASDMGREVPELKTLANDMIRVLKTNRVFFGDVHAGNIGRVNGRWVIVDPGHVAVLKR